MTSSATDKKLQIDKKHWKLNSTFTKISKLILKITEMTKKLKIYKNLEIKLEMYSYFKLENKLEIEFFVNGQVNISLKNSPESHEFCGLGTHIEH